MESTRPLRNPITCVRIRRPFEARTSQKSQWQRGAARFDEQSDDFGYLARPAKGRRALEFREIGRD